MSAELAPRQSPPAWTPAQDAVVRRNYGRIPSRRIGAALGRSGRQVAGRAKALGLIAPVVWTERETALVREHYRSGDSAATAALCAVLGRPRHQIARKARELGLARAKERRWTKEDDYRLSISWGRNSDAAVARKLGRTVDACKIRATRKLRKSRKDGLRGWTARGLARLFGVDDHKITRLWVANGWLRATATAIGAGANRTLLIDEAALTDFLRRYPHEYRWRRMDDPSGYYRRIGEQASAGLLTTAEVAARYGMSRNGVTAWIAKGRLPAVRGHTNGNAGVWMVRESDLAGWTPPRPELIGHRGRGKPR